jgi:hypothetical protein
MNSTDKEYSNGYVEIPQVFYSHITQKPFEECLVCKKKLLDSNTPYVIEKAFKRYPNYTAKDVVSEYAICLACNAEMQKSLSDHSKELINTYFNQRVDLMSRRHKLLQDYGPDIDAWLTNCLIYQTPITDISEYQIYAYCEGKYLVFSAMPFMISGRAIEEIADKLSPETKEVLDDFIDEHFGLPPELKELLKNRKLIHL